ERDRPPVALGQLDGVERRRGGRRLGHRVPLLEIHHGPLGAYLRFCATASTSACETVPPTMWTTPSLIQTTPAPRPVLSPNAWPCTPCTVTGLDCAWSAGTGMGSVPDGLSRAWIARCACGVRPGWASRVC